MNLEEQLRVWEAELRHRRGDDFRLEAALSIASCLSAMGRHEEAFKRLEAFAPKRPSPNLMAQWLSSRAYLLTMMGRADEALVHLDDAGVVVDDTTTTGRLLAGCIAGTRGIAELHLGRLQDAEGNLLRALEIGDEAVAADRRPDGIVARQQRALAGERWFWLAEIANRRGDLREAARRLELAAEAEGPFADRARARREDRGLA
jgi:tetratricopeptide (TPR) repeat protein